MWPSWATDRRESWGRGSPPRTQRTAPAAPTRPVSTSRHTSWPSSTRMSCSRRRNSSSVSGEEGGGGHEAWVCLEVDLLFHLAGLSLSTRARLLGGARRIGKGIRPPRPPSGPNLECGAGRLLLCPLLGQSRSLCPSAGTLARSGCGPRRSGLSLAPALE